MRRAIIHAERCRRSAALMIFLGVVAGCQSNRPPADTQASTAVEYPTAERVAQVDSYHGTTVTDPYRWLEDLDSSRTRRWVEAQNELSQPYLESIPARPWIKQRLAQLWNYERHGVPVREGGRYFWTRNDGLQNQSVLQLADALNAPARVLLDPNILSRDATIALADFSPSPDGRYVAYALSDGGTDWKTWRIRDVTTAQDLPDTLQFTKFTQVSWERDSSGLYYSRYPTDADGRGDDSRQVAIHRHRLGDAQSQDQLIFAVTDHPTRNPYPRLTEDGRFLIIEVFDGYATNGIYYLPLNGPGRPPARDAVRLLDEWRGRYTFLGSSGSTMYFATTDGAPRGRVIAIDVEHPERAAWRDIVPEAEETLEAASYVGGQVIASYLRDAHAHVRVFDASGQFRHDVPLPGNGTVDGFDGHASSPETFFAYSDYTTPAALYHYDATSNRVELFRAPAIAADTSQYVTEQVFFASKDGTRVPMFITRRRDMQRDGKTPFLLYGYGGFNNALTPVFSPSILVWLEMGGAYAVVNLRGGSEYGESWHEAGTKLKKQNVFNDFIAAARWLTDERYTSRDRLAVFGRSNGGLLVGAVLTQESGLFGAALPAVGVLDMLRYHTASANARQWSSDFGLSEDPEEFTALHAYSPYHNVQAGKCYPPTLITTADHDDRVVPWHSYKFGAALQAAQACPNPVLVRVETRAGHGAGKPVWMQIDDIADQWAFLTKHLHMDVAGPSSASAAAGGSTPTRGN
ncbi:MAG TPA: prolyl oligopeptidase family serine peptidase [Steroidobacteraceae bacterium]|nr:prolyl oligopeptidase family serine peptidase [Steroidobacteraceae bacterium]